MIPDYICRLGMLRERLRVSSVIYPHDRPVFTIYGWVKTCDLACITIWNCDGRSQYHLITLQLDRSDSKRN